MILKGRFDMPLKYIGNGQYIMGCPAHDLTDDEITTYADKIGMTFDETVALLVKRGLYKNPPKPKVKKVEEDE
jgi:hypothetical protein